MAIFSLFSPRIPRYYSSRRYLDGDQRPRHWQNILNGNQAGVRLTTESSRDVRERGEERENKVVTMRLTVDKKQFAARVAVEGRIEIRGDA